MSYERLADVYDYLMSEVPYDQWMKLVEEQPELSKRQGKKILDLACGTGAISIRLAKEGYDVTGVDLSEDMLRVAMDRAEDAGVKIPFFLQDMSELEGLGQFDAVVIFCDSLNYLGSPEAVQSTFQRVFDHLVPGGILLFDVHSPYQMKNVFQNETFTLNEEEIAYIWNSYPGEYRLSVEHDLSFFVLDEGTGLYERFDELHKQRTYPVADYEEWLGKAGFEVLSVTADFTEEAPNEVSQRIFFKVLKPQ